MHHVVEVFLVHTLLTGSDLAGVGGFATDLGVGWLQEMV